MDARDSLARPSLSRQMLPTLHGLLARPLSSYYLLINSSALLLLIGLTMVFSATSVKVYAEHGNAFAAIADQAVFALFGLVAFWVFQRLPVGTVRVLGRYILAASIVLLVVLNMLPILEKIGVLATPKIGPIEAQALWLHLGPVSMQPSELAKLGMVLWGAGMIARKGAALGHWRELATPLTPVVGVLLILVGYNDLGTMLMLLALVVGMLWTAGVRLRVFAALGVFGIACIALLILAAPSDMGSSKEGGNYRQERLTSFLTPLEKCDVSGACYQLFEARAAISKGGWFGVGLGRSATKWNWLPEADDDFIFAVIAEELGVVGCLVVLALFSVLIYTGFRIARRVDDPFRRLAATAVTTWLLAQAVINIGGVVGLLPITGLTLPFISAGGSSLVVTMAAVGVLASFARAEPYAAWALNARPAARWVRLLWAPLPPVPASRRPAQTAQPTRRSPAATGRKRTPERKP